MGKKDDRIDAYIAKSQDFAKPILRHIRERVHEACPDVEETMKWSSPTFTYKGLLCGMSAFKEHCAFGFWKGSLILGKREGKAEEAAGDFGRITKVSDLPSKKVLSGYIKEAMKLNENGVKVRPAEESADGSRGSRRPGRGAAEKRQSASELRRLQSQPQTRVYRVDHRGKDRGYPLAAARDRDRMDGRGQAEELEIYELLTGGLSWFIPLSTHVGRSSNPWLPLGRCRAWQPRQSLTMCTSSSPRSSR